MKLTIFMKSGNVITIPKVTDVRTTYHREQGYLLTINFDFAGPYPPLPYLNVLEVEAITQETDDADTP